MLLYLDICISDKEMNYTKNDIIKTVRLHSLLVIKNINVQLRIESC